MILKRNWVGNDGDIDHPTLQNVLKGLSPLLVMPLTRSEIAFINEADEELASASHTTIEYHRQDKRKVQVEMPRG